MLEYSPIPPLLSFTGKRWLFGKEMPPASSLIECLAVQRGIDLAQIPSWAGLPDPFTLGDMETAVSRIQNALQKKETIGIIGDYDADGITGTAQLVRFFRRHGTEPQVILPHRQRDGYGVKKSFIDALHQKNVTLILTVDTGIGHVEEIAYARSLGMDVIVTDHHTMKEEVPDAIILHPQLSKSKEHSLLSGSGVAFTLVRALENNDWEEKDIDVALAAIGTIADVVPLLEENRTIVQLGLAAMNASRFVPQSGTHSKRTPIFDFARSVVKEGELVTSTHIGFRLAPRINASGRLADPLIALQGLLEGGEYLTRLHTLNMERQEATQRHMELAETLVGDGHILLIRSAAFHAGIIGLIAGRLTERFGRPSVVACEEGDTITCSLRSIPSYHIAEALARCSSHLLSFGGHSAAAGCTLRAGAWDAFSDAMIKDIEECCSSEDFGPTLAIDCELSEADLTVNFVQSLSLLEPFGAGNPEPKFLLRNQELSSLKQVGEEGRHLQCRIGSTKAIGFGLGELAEKIPDRCDIVGRLGIDTWNGFEKVQIFIEDMAPADQVLNATRKQKLKQDLRAGAMEYWEEDRVWVTQQ